MITGVGGFGNQCEGSYCAFTGFANLKEYAIANSEREMTMTDNIYQKKGHSLKSSA